MRKRKLASRALAIGLPYEIPVIFTARRQRTSFHTLSSAVLIALLGAVVLIGSYNEMSKHGGPAECAPLGSACAPEATAGGSTR
jgi:hypothetical protein